MPGRGEAAGPAGLGWAPAGPAGLGWAPGPAGPAGAQPSVRETVEQILQAVRDRDDAAIRTLLADLTAAADTAALLYLRERLDATQ
ncbi:hypothetical protein [Streptomyces virginiae]|uniref:hypothetical protein n=1 Tax=Streptomyces virginiae TaxID=1961 RepID=UPI0037006020